MSPMVEYEYLTLDFPRHIRREDVRRALTEHAEYGHWELHRSLLYVGGLRRAYLRRRIIRVRRAS